MEWARAIVYADNAVHRDTNYSGGAIRSPEGLPGDLDHAFNDATPADLVVSIA